MFLCRYEHGLFFPHRSDFLNIDLFFTIWFFFLCRYEHGIFFPHLRESNFDYIGGFEDQPSCGKNFNIPLNKFGLGDEDYLSIFHQILMPVTHEFRPDLILVSAGYDSAIGRFLNLR